MAGIFFDDGVPVCLIKEIEAAPKSRKPEKTYLLEMQNEKNLLIISHAGIIRRVDVEKISGIDVLNIIEIMEDQISMIEKKKELSNVSSVSNSKESPFEHRPDDALSEEFYEDVEKRSLLSFAQPDNRIFLGISFMSEEGFTMGIKVSAGFEFFRFGFSAKKGLDIVFPDNSYSLSWQAFGLFTEMSLIDIWKFNFSTGIEGNFYNVLDRYYIRENIYLKTYLKGKFFVPAFEFHFSPTKLVLEKESYKQETSRFYFGIAFYFAF